MLYSYQTAKGSTVYTPSFTIATIRAILNNTYYLGVQQHKF